MKEGQRFRADPHRALARALAALLEGEVECLSQAPWASVTITGSIHRFLVTAARASGRAEGIDEIEFAIPGHLVASIAVAERHRRAAGEALVIEALTLEED